MPDINWNLHRLLYRRLCNLLKPYIDKIWKVYMEAKADPGALEGIYLTKIVITGEKWADFDKICLLSRRAWPLARFGSAPELKRSLLKTVLLAYRSWVIFSIACIKRKFIRCWFNTLVFRLYVSDIMCHQLVVWKFSCSLSNCFFVSLSRCSILYESESWLTGNMKNCENKNKMITMQDYYFI